MSQSSRTSLRVNTVLTTVLAIFVVVFALAAAAAIVTALKNQRVIADLGRGNIHRASELNAATSQIFQARALLTEAKTSMEGGLIQARDDALDRVDTLMTAAAASIEQLSQNVDDDLEGATHQRAVLDAYTALTAEGMRPLAAALKGWNGIVVNQITDKLMTPLSASFVDHVDNYQRHMRERGERSVAHADRVLTLAIGAAAGLCAFMCMLAIVSRLVFGRIVLRPLHIARHHFDRMANNDLTATINVRGDNEIGVLFSAMQRMQTNLSTAVRKVRSGAVRISDDVHGLVIAGVDNSARTTRQAAALEETAANMIALSTAVADTAHHAQDAARGASGAMVLAREAGGAAEQAALRMHEMAQEIGRIVTIVEVVQRIAFQTNILALNASVEAARAGVAGRGFAVVATEVRNLALHSAQAAKEIKVLIEATTVCAEHSVHEASAAGRISREVVAAIEHVTVAINDISTSTSDQASGIASINEAITEIDRATQESAVLAEHAAMAAQMLAAQARELSEATAAFVISDSHETSTDDDQRQSSRTLIALEQRDHSSESAPTRERPRPRPLRSLSPAGYD